MECKSNVDWFKVWNPSFLINLLLRFFLHLSPFAFAKDASAAFCSMIDPTIREPTESLMIWWCRDAATTTVTMLLQPPRHLLAQEIGVEEAKEMRSSDVDSVNLSILSTALACSSPESCRSRFDCDSRIFTSRRLQIWFAKSGDHFDASWQLAQASQGSFLIACISKFAIVLIFWIVSTMAWQRVLFAACWQAMVTVMADQSISGGGIFLKIQGQSGKMTFATTEPIGSAPDKVQIDMSMLQELASDGTTLGGRGNAKHSFNSFATQTFTFGSPVASTIAGVAMGNGTGVTAKDYSITKVAFTSYLGGGDPVLDSKLQIESIIFMEDAILQFENPDGSYIYPTIAAGTVKFNVLMSQWNWCENDCKSSNGVGDSVRLTITMTNQVTADSSQGSSCTDGCQNGAVEDLGGVFLGVLNTYSIKKSDGTMTQYTLPKNPELTVDPPPGSPGSSRTTTLVLQFPRTNFGDTDTLIYDPLLSYSDITESDPSDGQTSTTADPSGTSATTETTDTDGTTGTTTSVSTVSTSGITSDAQTSTDPVNTTEPTEPEPPSGASRFGFGLGQVSVFALLLAMAWMMWKNMSLRCFGLCDLCVFEFQVSNLLPFSTIFNGSVCGVTTAPPENQRFVVILSLGLP